MFDKQVERGITIALNKPALVTGTTSTITTTVTSSHVCNGKFQTPQTALTNAVTPTTDYNTGAAFPALNGTATEGEGCVIVYAYLEGGADGIASVKCMQGKKQALDASGNFKIAPQFPNIPNNVTPFAYQVLKQYGSATSVTFSSSSWNATGYTNAIVHVAQLPMTPQVS